MSRTQAALAALCTVLAVGCATSTAKDKAARPPLDPRIVELFGGRESVQNIAQPKTVQAFRIGDQMSERSDGPQPFRGYPVMAGPIDVSQADREQLAKSLLDTDGYQWDRNKECIFQPGVALRFTAKGSPTEVIYCFSCDDLMVVRDGKQVGYQLTATVREPLLAIVKRLFPKDAEIQKIKTTE